MKAMLLQTLTVTDLKRKSCRFEVVAFIKSGRQVQELTPRDQLVVTQSEILQHGVILEKEP